MAAIKDTGEYTDLLTSPHRWRQSDIRFDEWNICYIDGLSEVVLSSSDTANFAVMRSMENKKKVKVKAK